MASSIFKKIGDDGEEMTFVDHLEALRWHIVRSLLAVIVFAIFIFIKMDWVFERVIAGPLQNDFVSYLHCAVLAILYIWEMPYVCLR